MSSKIDSLNQASWKERFVIRRKSTNYVLLAFIVMAFTIGWSQYLRANSENESAAARTVQNFDEITLHLPLILVPHYTYVPAVFNFPPGLLDNPYPPDKSVRQSLNTYLAWGNPQNIRQNVTFAVYLDADNENPTTLIADNLTENHFDPETLVEDTQYYWRVVAKFPNGGQLSSMVWAFRTDFFPDIPEIGAMVRVPAGEFLMGCDPENSGYQCFGNQLPLHRVYLDAFEIDKYEVTNQQYRACVYAGVCNPPRKERSLTRKKYFNNPEYDYYPVIYVSHADAEKYCKWVGKRLPTEAEWEKASRGAVDTRPWPWGNEPFDCSRANHKCMEPNDTVRVDQYPRGQSPYGAMNMSGNVWEWVQDFYDDNYYLISPYYNPVNTVQSQSIPYYSVRGGCFRHNWWYLRSSHRSGGHWGDEVGDDVPLFRSHVYGFRCARSVTEP